jgi:ribokinase
VLVVNEAEAAQLTAAAVSDLAAAERAAERLAEAADAVVVTMGAAGAVVWESNGTTRLPALQVEAVDTTAAGDAFVGALAHGLVEGLNLLEAVRLGTAAGAAATTRLGARSSLPRPADLNRLFGPSRDSSPRLPE